MKELFAILARVLQSMFGAKKEEETKVPLAEVIPIREPERKITWKKSPNFSSRRGKKVTTIVLHHTATFNAKGDIAWMCNPTAKVSAHYVIDLEGNITQLVKNEDKAWHAGVSELDGEKNVNAFSIGIELVGDTGKKPLTEDQWGALIWLVRKLMDQYDIDASRVIDHRYIAPGRKVDLDPKHFDWTRFYADLDCI